MQCASVALKHWRRDKVNVSIRCLGRGIESYVYKWPGGRRLWPESQVREHQRMPWSNAGTGLVRFNVPLRFGGYLALIYIRPLRQDGSICHHLLTIA